MQFSELRSWIDSQQADLIAALQALVEINSYTDNTAGVDQAMQYVSRLAEGMNLRVHALQGRHRLITNRSTQSQNDLRVLLISHVDTVHPPDGDFQHYEPQADGYVRGPGIGDMKGGLLMGLWAVKAMQLIEPGCDVRLVVSADEEKGSPTLRDWLTSGSHAADYALGLEPGFPQGALSYDIPMGFVYERKGCGRISFKVKGKAAHAGGAWQDGISAVDGLAHRIIKIHALTDPERGITTNVGLIKGGTAANTIAEDAFASVDFRFRTQADGEEITRKICEIVGESVVHNTHLDRWEEGKDCTLELLMPAMEKTPACDPLIELVNEEAKRLGLNMIPISRGGGSDANYVSGSGVPAICGMGAPAEGIHTTEERILLPMLFDRLELLVSVVHRLVKESVPAVKQG